MAGISGRKADPADSLLGTGQHAGESPLPPLAIEGLPTPDQVTLLRLETVQLAQRLVDEFPRQARASLLLGNTYRQMGYPLGTRPEITSEFSDRLLVLLNRLDEAIALDPSTGHHYLLGLACGRDMGGPIRAANWRSAGRACVKKIL